MTILDAIVDRLTQVQDTRNTALYGEDYTHALDQHDAAAETGAAAQRAAAQATVNALQAADDASRTPEFKAERAGERATGLANHAAAEQPAIQTGTRVRVGHQPAHQG